MSLILYFSRNSSRAHLNKTFSTDCSSCVLFSSGINIHNNWVLVYITSTILTEAHKYVSAHAHFQLIKLVYVALVNSVFRFFTHTAREADQMSGEKKWHSFASSPSVSIVIILFAPEKKARPICSFLFYFYFMPTHVICFICYIIVLFFQSLTSSFFFRSSETKNY
jgi:uncharacterized membrane protein